MINPGLDFYKVGPLPVIPISPLIGVCFTSVTHWFCLFWAKQKGDSWLNLCRDQLGGRSSSTILAPAKVKQQLRSEHVTFRHGKRRCFLHAGCVMLKKLRTKQRWPFERWWFQRLKTGFEFKKTGFEFKTHTPWKLSMGLKPPTTLNLPPRIRSESPGFWK